MKIITAQSTILATILLSGFFFATNAQNQSKEKDSTDARVMTGNQPSEQENPYNILRNMALGVTMDQLGLKDPGDETNVFGIVMDWDIGGGIATVAAYQTGDASMYLSTGGGVIGGGEHDNVRKAVFTYIELAQDYLNLTDKSESPSLPDPKCVRFHLLTNKGTFSSQEEVKNLEDRSSKWIKLFEEANKLLTELRLSTESK